MFSKVYRGGYKTSMFNIKSIPFPYRAMLSVCSDLDETANAATYFDTMRFLNTSESTQHGRGVELEVGNTLYFDMPTDQFSYSNTDDLGREKLHQLIHSGHIDCIHSFGDHVRSRSRVQEILAELQAHNSRMQVWIDHAIAPTNLDNDIMQGQGNQPGAEAYHADLSRHYGIRYVWLGRVTSVIGQDVQRRLAGIWDSRCPLQSAVTLGKETLKGWLPRLGRPKYQMHVDNRILRPIQLADGGSVWEFLRCNPSPWGVSMHETGDGFATAMTAKFLNRLVKRGGKSIVYTHLGKLKNVDNTFTADAVAAWQRLKEFQRREQVLVCTTRRLLDFTLMTETITVTHETPSDTLIIDIDNPQQLPLDGLSLTTSQSLSRFTNVEIRVNEQTDPRFQIQPQGEKTLIYLPWQPLPFPALAVS